MDNVLLQSIRSIQLYPFVNQFSSEFTYHIWEHSHSINQGCGGPMHEWWVDDCRDE